MSNGIIERFPLGTKVIVNSPDCPAWAKGQTATVGAHDTLDSALYTLYVKFDTPNENERGMWWVKDSDVTIVAADYQPQHVTPDNMTLEQARSIIALMENDFRELGLKRDSAFARAERAEQRLTEQQRNYRHDMQHWETTMRAEKENQSWCDEGTNDVIDALNDGFEGRWEIDKYETEFDVEVEIEGTMTTTATVTVTAASQEDADELVKNDPDNYVNADDLLTSEARNTEFTDISFDVG